MGVVVDETPVWLRQAECSRDDAPPMFEDAWGEGDRTRRIKRATALRCCLRCPVKLDCGRAGLAQIDAGIPLYGVWCGIEFTDVTPCRQEKEVNRLRSNVLWLETRDGA